MKTENKITLDTMDLIPVICLAAVGIIFWRLSGEQQKTKAKAKQNEKRKATGPRD